MGFPFSNHWIGGKIRTITRKNSNYNISVIDIRPDITWIGLMFISLGYLIPYLLENSGAYNIKLIKPVFGLIIAQILAFV